MMNVKLSLVTLSIVAALSTNVVQAQQTSVYATGLNGPRGLKFGPDGALYVAEAGLGGTNDACLPVVPVVGPYHGGPTARISKITAPGQVSTVVDGLPSGQTSLPSGDTLGVADVAFLGSNLYALVAGGGCSHGNPDAPAGVIRINQKQGTWRYVDNLSEYLLANPVDPTLDDFEREGTFFSMVVNDGHFYAVEPNSGEIVRINPGGHTEPFIQIAKTEGHVVPTASVFHDGAFYVGTLSEFPIVPGSASVYKISEKGEITGKMTGFTTVTGLAFDKKGRLYVLEMSAEAGFPTGFAGKIVRVNASGQKEDFVTGLMVPTGLTIGPDGALYVSNWGAVPGSFGQIVRITIQD